MKYYRDIHKKVLFLIISSYNKNNFKKISSYIVYKMSDSPVNTTPKQAQVSDEFKQKIIRWVKLDDDLRKIRETTKEINDEKKQHEEFILSYLENIEGQEIGISDGKLSRKVTKKQEPLKKENIAKALTDIVKDENKANIMTDHILKSRATTDKVALKRTRIRN
jgi:hypothetical protein